MKYYDISVPITSTMLVWPGDPPVKFKALSSIQEGDNSNLTQIQMSLHTGTHIDAPKHFIDQGLSVDLIPMDKLMGEVLVLEFEESVNVISAQSLENHPQLSVLRESKKVLFKTRNSTLWHTYPSEFQTDYTGIDTSGAQILADLDLDLIGIDYLSIAPYKNTKKPHQILLSKEIVLLEGIDLTNIRAGTYQLFCLPLRIMGYEGTPARAILFDRATSI